MVRRLFCDSYLFIVEFTNYNKVFVSSIGWIEENSCCVLWLLVRLEAIACGADLSFSPDVLFFIFFPAQDLWDVWADRHEILHDGQYLTQFYNAGPKFWGAHPTKISGAKKMQNLARFRTTLKFGGEYLRNGWRYSKLDSHSVYRDSSCVRRNKYGEVWSSDLGDLDS